jgi:hypothetical protein
LRPTPLLTPLEGAVTAQRIYVDCLVDQARNAGTGRAAPSIAIAIARRRCSPQERALDDAYRVWQRSLEVRATGLSRTRMRRLLDEAEARIVAARGGRP